MTCLKFDTPLPSAMHEFPASLKPEVEKWLENDLAEASTRRESLSEHDVRARIGWIAHAPGRREAPAKLQAENKIGIFNCRWG